MSTWTTIECDRCGDTWIEEEDRLPDFTESVDVCGDWYNHICEDCWESIFYCEWCDNYHEMDSHAATYCEDLEYMPCTDCQTDAHASLADWDGECPSCGYTDEGFDVSMVKAPWLSSIG